MVLLCKDDRQDQQHRTDLELEAWIKRHYNDYIKSGLLALARAEPDIQSGCFHQCLSKHASHAAAVMYHRLASGVDAPGVAAEPQLCAGVSPRRQLLLTANTSW